MPGPDGRLGLAFVANCAEQSYGRGVPTVEPSADSGRPGADDGLQLGPAAATMYADLRLAPFLRQLLVGSGELVNAPAGSVSLVDSGRNRYTKMAERGAACQLGLSFPLDEGVTGQVVMRRRPVLLKSYGEIRAGHLAARHPARSGAVVGIPIWWRGDVIGANVMFAGRPRHFTTVEVDELETLTQLAAAGIVHGRGSDPSLSHLIRERARPDAELAGLHTMVAEVGPARPVPASIAQAAIGLITLVERAAARREPTARLHVAVVHRPDGLRLLVHDETPGLTDTVSSEWLGIGARDWNDLLDIAGAGVSVEHVAGWGTMVRADLPYGPAALPDNPSPFTERESEVASHLARGLSDQSIAKELVISPKTVEKHVSAVLRKTGTRNRTAAVLRTIDLGWLPPNRQSPADVHVVEEVADTTYGGYVGGFPPFRQPSNLCLADRRGWATRPNPAVGEA